MITAHITASPSATFKITYEEFLARFDDVRAEWVDGEVIVMSPISRIHQRLGWLLMSLVGRYLEQHPVGEVYYESFQMKTGPTLPGREPDIIFVANEHLDRLRDTYLDGPADLVVEIVSVDSRHRDRAEKFSEYEQGGVPEYWLIDPLGKRADFYRLDSRGKYSAVPLNPDGYYVSFVLPDLRIKPDWLWQEPLPRLLDILTESHGLSE